MSENLQETALNYFQAPGNYFWHWAEELEVAEWRTGTTICYREDLLGVLNGLLAADLALPQLGAVMLLLKACSGWTLVDEEQLLLQHRQYPMLDDTLMTTSREGAVTLLRQVAALPPELRTGAPKQHLFREVFGEATSQGLEFNQARAVVGEWASGRLDNALMQAAEPSQWSKFTFELRALAKAAGRFEAAGSLELLLRTGLDELPAPLPEPTPTAPEVPESPPDLLDALARDHRTAGLARLTRQLVAALHIPLHTHGASEQPLGGVSDISNRGNFDRLLLSELAYDDATLLARLVNNEALYLRREAPPRPDVKPRTILLDTTLHLWGLPRVFALAAALAWTSNSRRPGPLHPVAAYALGGQDVTPLDLETFDGVVQALATLDPALHCGAALQAFVREQAAEAPTDCLLITEAGVLHQPGFSQELAAAQPALRFLLTVDRGGALELYELLNGHRTLVSTARYDLDELLFAAAPLPARRPDANPLAPAFLQQEQAPLYFPVSGVRMSIHNTFYTPRLGVLAITDSRRVLYWPDKKHGALEVLPDIENGTCYFGNDDENYQFVLVAGPGTLKVYFVHWEGAVESVDLSTGLDDSTETVQVVFGDSCFFVRHGSAALVFDCRARAIREDHNLVFPAAIPSSFRFNKAAVKRYINNGYNVLHRITRIGVSDDDELVLDGHRLHLVSTVDTLSHQLRLANNGPGNGGPLDTIKASKDTVALTVNPRLLFRRFTWPNGSSAVVDPRGLLHLRSADASIPEITLVLVLNHPTAAWAADGHGCGSEYFSKAYGDNQLPVADFYRLYLQRFIARLG